MEQNKFEANNNCSACFETNCKTKDLPKQPSTLSKTKLTNTKQLSQFLFLCVAVATVQPTLQIPVFSNLFAPQVEVETPATILPALSVSIFSSEATETDISCAVNVENSTDVKQENIFLCIVESENANDEFWKILDANTKKICQKNVDSNLFLCTFTKYASSTGAESIKSSTKYSILLIKDNKIVEKKEIQTKKMVYVTSVSFKTDESHLSQIGYEMVEVRSLQFHANINSKFVDYERIYYQLINTKTGEIEFFALSPDRENYTNEDYAGLEKRVTQPREPYQLKIYVSSLTPEKINHKGQINPSPDECYYLIYTHEEIINF